MIFAIANLLTMRKRSLRNTCDLCVSVTLVETVTLEKAETQLSPHVVSVMETRALPGKARFLATRTCILQSHPTFYTIHRFTLPFRARTHLNEIQNRSLTRNEVSQQSWRRVQQERPSPCPSSLSVQLLTYLSSPLRSNMSSANRGAGPSRGNNKRARDDGLSSSGALPPSSRK